MKAKVLIIGSGGREHALARSIAKSPKVQQIFCAPGNGGTAQEPKCQNITATTIPELVVFAKEQQITLTVPGPEALLVEGIADAFHAEGLAIFGPHKAAAELEGSKVFSKEFMEKHGVSTARAESFDSFAAAKKSLASWDYPLVVKADGLAAGKGVIICHTETEATAALTEIMQDKCFGNAGSRILIEQFLDGWEASFLVLYDGKTYRSMISAQDHKQIFDGNKGPNTGGMGVIAPNPRVTPELMQEIDRTILAPTFRGIAQDGLTFAGVLFCGVMVQDGNPYLLEYNVRFGDPETEAVLPLLTSDLYEVLYSCTQGKLAETSTEWKEGSCCTVVMSSEGYPGSYPKGRTITGIDQVTQTEVYIAGATAPADKGALQTSGGRVLAVSATAPTLSEARHKAYTEITKIHFDGCYYRKDIGTAGQ